MNAAAKIAIVLAGSLVLGSGIGAGVGAVVNAVRPAAQDDIRETDALTSDPEGSPSEPQPSAVPVETSDPATWTIDFDSVGPIELGEAVTSARGDMSAWVAEPVDVCTWTNWFSRPEISLVFILTEDESAIDLIDISNRGQDARVGPKTAEGIGLGSTLDELTAAYPDVQRTGDYGPDYLYYAITDGSNWIVFAVEPTGISRIAVGPYDQLASEYCG